MPGITPSFQECEAHTCFAKWQMHSAFQPVRITREIDKSLYVSVSNYMFMDLTEKEDEKVKVNDYTKSNGRYLGELCLSILQFSFFHLQSAYP